MFDCQSSGIDLCEEGLCLGETIGKLDFFGDQFSPLFIKGRFVGLLAQMKLAFFGLKLCDAFFEERLTFGQVRVLKLKLFEDSARFEQ